MAFNGEAPPSGERLPQSAKTQEVLDFLEQAENSAPGNEGGDNGALALEGLLRALYEPALAVAAAINLVRQGNAGMAPFIGAAGVVLSQALEPLVVHFGDTELEFEDAFERIGVPVVRFADLPDVPDVETPATEAQLDREDRQSPGATTRPEEPLTDAEAEAEEATWD